MNIVLLDPRQTQSEIWTISAKRQLEHLQTHLDIQVGDTLKVGIREGKRYLTEISEITEKIVRLKPLKEEAVPAKLPVTLIVALPRPKVLRRLIMDAVTLGVEKIILLHSYRVDKSYWQTPFLQQLDHYIELGLEQAGWLLTFGQRGEFRLELELTGASLNNSLEIFTPLSEPSTVILLVGVFTVPIEFEEVLYTVVLAFPKLS